MDIAVVMWIAVLIGVLQGSFTEAQCSGTSEKPNPLQLTEKVGHVTMTSSPKKTQKCSWKFPRTEISKAIIIYVENANMRTGKPKRCAAQIIFPGFHARQCSVSKLCRIFAHENSTCSLAFLTSQMFSQCEKSIITSDKTAEREMRFAVSTPPGKKISFKVKYKIIGCPEIKNISKHSFLSLDSGPIPINSLLKRHFFQQNVTQTTPSSSNLSSTDTTRPQFDEPTTAIYAMIAVILVLFICLIIMSVKIYLQRSKKTDSPFHNPTVVAYVHESQRNYENESQRRDASASIDSIPSNAALYAEIGSGVWSANQVVHEYIDLHQPITPRVHPSEQPTSRENRNSTESCHSRSFPDYLYSKVNMLKKKRATSNYGHKETKLPGAQRNSAEL